MRLQGRPDPLVFEHKRIRRQTTRKAWLYRKNGNDKIFDFSLTLKFRAMIQSGFLPVCAVISGIEVLIPACIIARRSIQVALIFHLSQQVFLKIKINMLLYYL